MKTTAQIKLFNTIMYLFLQNKFVNTDITPVIIQSLMSFLSVKKNNPTNNTNTVNCI